MRSLPKPWRALTSLWTPPSPTTCMSRPPNGPTSAPPSLPCYSQKRWLTTLIQWPQPSISPSGTLTHPLPVTQTCPGDEISCQLTRSKPAPIPAKTAWEKPWRAHHMKAPCCSYFRSRLRTRGSGQGGGERERIDFHEAVEAVCQVIVFARSLPHVTNNHRNAEHRIRQRET